MVTRCVCCDISLAQLLQVARGHGLTNVESLHTAACFGQGCGLCLPYVALTLRTGCTAFDPAEADSLLMEPCEASTASAATLVRQDGE